MLFYTQLYISKAILEAWPGKSGKKYLYNARNKLSAVIFWDIFYPTGIPNFLIYSEYLPQFFSIENIILISLVESSL